MTVLQVLTAFGVLQGVGLNTESLSRDDLDPAATFPDEETTGIISPAEELTVVSTTAAFNTPGQVVQNFRFQNWVSVNAPNVTFINCMFEGPTETAGFQKALVTCTNIGVSNLIVKDCTFRAQAPTSGVAGILGHDFSVIRCRFSHVVDAVDPAVKSGSTDVNVTIRGCWVDQLAFFSPDPYHPSSTDNKSHDDGVQASGGRNIIIEYNRIECFYATDVGDALEPSVDDGTTHISGNTYYPNLAGTSCIIMSNITYPPGALIVRGNWLDGGAVGINLSGSTASFLDPDDPAVIVGNRFGTGFRLGSDFGIMKKSSQYATVEGNMRWNKSNPWDDTVPFNTIKAG